LLFRLLIIVTVLCWPVRAQTESASPRDDLTKLRLLSIAGVSQWWLVVGAGPDQQGAPWGVVRSMDLKAVTTPRWTPVVTLARPAADVAPLGERLVVLFEDQSWSLVWPQTILPGRALPGGEKALAIASHRRTVWFATERSLVALEGDVFADPVALPEDAAPAGWRDAHLACLADGRPFLLARDSTGWLTGWLWSDNNWANLGRLVPTDDAVPLALDEAEAPTVVMIEPTGRLRMARHDGEHWTPLSPVPVGDELARANATALLLGGELRVIAPAPNRVLDQTIDQAGNPVGKPRSTALASTPPPASPVEIVVKVLAVMMMVAALVLTVRSPVVLPDPDAKPLRLPSLALRLASGMLDAMPLILGPMLFAVRRLATGIDPAAMPDTIDELLIYGGIFVYIAYTALTELLLGRTPGKMLCGLVVVSRDGKPATTRQRLIRNILRLLDIYLIPLLIVAATPLRQRLGDLVAGTVVVEQEPRDPTR
jgi:uncharacterized RDD family membrane protein YckC